ncbi:MAG: hypothetical protein V4754_08575 [Pseudomonadota bacterium]
MRIPSICLGLMLALSALSGPAAALTTSTRTVFDMTLLDSQLRAQSRAFTGWNFIGSSDAVAGALSDSDLSASELSFAQAGGVRAGTGYGNAFAATDGGRGQSALSMLAGFSLAGGAHLSLVIPYSITLAVQAGDQARGDIGLQIWREGSTVAADSASFDAGNLRVHTGVNSQSAFIYLDLINSAASPASYTIFGQLSASVRYPLAAVPELPGWLTMLAGIGLLCVWRARAGQPGAPSRPVLRQTVTSAPNRAVWSPFPN